MTVSLANRLHT